MDVVVKAKKTLFSYFTNSGFWREHLTNWHKANNVKNTLFKYSSSKIKIFISVCSFLLNSFLVFDVKLNLLSYSIFLHFVLIPLAHFLHAHLLSPLVFTYFLLIIGLSGGCRSVQRDSFIHDFIQKIIATQKTCANLEGGVMACMGVLFFKHGANNLTRRFNCTNPDDLRNTKGKSMLRNLRNPGLIDISLSSCLIFFVLLWNEIKQLKLKFKDITPSEMVWHVQPVLTPNRFREFLLNCFKLKATEFELKNQLSLKIKMKTNPHQI
ncbi:hypothetical protein VP01_166g3 [Puccinia sorghi]|uniref:Uncharacterized protein n=1 Tax=Puccinia sorghi TaxID=27349 RepID=A0A0L6VG34_9BASI|nr:hypothetical protein VP01_166g3 [Puccinia sorghi]